MLAYSNVFGRCLKVHVHLFSWCTNTVLVSNSLQLPTHYVNPSGVYQPGVSTLEGQHEFSAGELLARAEFIQHCDKKQCELKHCASFKGLSHSPYVPRPMVNKIKPSSVVIDDLSNMQAYYIL